MWSQYAFVGSGGPDTGDLTDRRHDMLDLDQHFCFAVYSTAHMFNRLYRPLLEELGLTYPQYLALVVLWHEGEQSVTALAERLKLETSTLTPMLKRLEKAGFVSRSRSRDDERMVRVSLTEAGRQAASRVPPINSAIADAIGETAEEREAIQKALLRIRQRLEAAIA
jgi:DNA-binding MarR family transcriptional regulator